MGRSMQLPWKIINNVAYSASRKAKLGSSGIVSVQEFCSAKSMSSEERVSVEKEEGEGTVLQPGDTIKPYIPDSVIHELVEKVFGLRVTSWKELNSYDDKNFLVKVEESSSIKNKNITTLWPHGYVLKVLNSMDSKKPNYIGGQNQMMLYLSTNGFTCPVPQKSVNGELASLQKIYKEGTDDWQENNLPERPNGMHLVRLLTFVPGKILYEVPYTTDIFYQMGEYIARIDRCLQKFHHPTYDTHTTVWSLESIPKLGDFAYAIRDEGRRNLVKEIIAAFVDVVTPNYPHMKRGILHGDFNEQNILVEPDGDGWKVCGVIDFGDTHASYYLFEVALTITYGMIESKDVDILDVGGHVLAGYTSIMPLSDKEINILKVCVASRYSQSLGMGEYTYSLDPGNEYLLTTAKRGWPQLEKFWATPAEEIYSRWRRIMATYKH